MSLRQKEKSEMTHQEIKAAALRLFLENGYKNTSVQDIVTESGYSIGSFYNHYKTKRDVLAIDEMKAIRTPEELADYLIDNSNAFDRDEKTISLAKAAQEDLVTVGKNYEGVRDISQLYLKEIASVLRIFCPHTEEVILLSHASVLDSIQYSHSEVTRKKVGYFFDDDTVKRDILLLMNAWIQEDIQGMKEG